jgi:site-specific recombinase XerC
MTQVHVASSLKLAGLRRSSKTGCDFSASQGREGANRGQSTLFQCESRAVATDHGETSAHPLRGDEVRALRELRRRSPDSAFVFASERGGPFTPDAVNRLVKRIGERAGLAFPVHAHMLRHGCGYALANAGHDTRRIQDWLGHRSIQHTVCYSELTATRFKDFWR